MRSKSILLFLIFALNLIPFHPAQAQGRPHRSVDDALAFLYLSDAILTPQEEVDDSPDSSGLYLILGSYLQDSDANPLLARIIHAKKMQRNDLDANCALLISQLQAQGKQCEADQVLANCETKRSEINSQIGFYHKVRGDQRKFFTRVWHSVKRNSESLWYRIGPAGRNILRNLGQDALQIVASGGSLSGTSIKGLVKHQLKTIGRERLRQVVYQGVERLLLGQLEIARAAGVDLCAEGPAAKGPTISEAESSPSKGTFQYTLTTRDVDFSWDTLLPERNEFDDCGSLWPSNDSERFAPITFTVTIDTQNETISALIAGQRKIESYSMGESGDLEALINQGFTVLLDGPYQYSAAEEDVLQSYQGTAQLTLTMDGKRYCGYWVCSDEGECSWEDYWVTGSDTKKLTTPYQLDLVTYDGETGILYLMLTSQSWGENAGFWLNSKELELSPDELDALWQE